MKSVPFLVAFTIAAFLSLILSATFGIGVPYVLGGFVLAYLFGMMLIGVFSASPKPHADEPQRQVDSEHE